MDFEWFIVGWGRNIGSNNESQNGDISFAVTKPLPIWEGLVLYEYH